MQVKRSYSEKLKDSRWQRKRLEIMGRDEFECQKCHCKDHGMLSVHHRHYINGREPWDYPGELLITLCQQCHKEEENNVIKADEVLKSLHFWGYFNTDIVSVLNKMIESKIQSLSNGERSSVSILPE